MMWEDFIVKSRSAAGLLGAAHLSGVKGANGHRCADVTLVVLLISAAFSPEDSAFVSAPKHLC